MNPAHADSRRGQWITAVLVLLVGVIAYANSFGGPFILDDVAAIEQNPQIRSLIPFEKVSPVRTTISRRPVVTFSFALDYAIGRLRVEIYHATNLLIHLLCALLIFGIVRRTLLRFPSLADSGTWVAAMAAAIWVAHPLDTQAVTYIVQRVESLASLFILAAIYCVIRAGAAARRGWAVLAVISCGLGMASKEIAFVAPILAVLYDRTFIAGSFKEAMRRRWKMYAGMFATWGVILLVIHNGGRETIVGFHLGISATDYARTELNVIAHYFRLAFWPTDLVLDYYDWPIATRWADVAWQGWFVAALGVGTVIAVRKIPWLGFLGMWFFLILAPSSSILPIKQEAAAEHRMYLPLAGVVVLVVVGGWGLVRRWRWARVMAGVLGCAVIVSSIWLTNFRNEQYSSAVGIWTDTVAKRPNSARARFNLGKAWAEESLEFPRGSSEARAAANQAADEFRTSLALEPQYTQSIFALGESLAEAGNPAAAEDLYTQAMAKNPEIAADLSVERGNLRATRSDWKDATADFREAIADDPRDPEPHYFLGLVFEQQRDWGDAKLEFENAEKLSPGFKDAAALAARMKKLQAGF